MLLFRPKLNLKVYMYPILLFGVHDVRYVYPILLFGVHVEAVPPVPPSHDWDTWDRGTQ